MDNTWTWRQSHLEPLALRSVRLYRDPSLPRFTRALARALYELLISESKSSLLQLPFLLFFIGFVGTNRAGDPGFVFAGMVCYFLCVRLFDPAVSPLRHDLVVLLPAGRRDRWLSWIATLLIASLYGSLLIFCALSLASVVWFVAAPSGRSGHLLATLPLSNLWTMISLFLMGYATVVAVAAMLQANVSGPALALVIAFAFVLSPNRLIPLLLPLTLASWAFMLWSGWRKLAKRDLVARESIGNSRNAWWSRSQCR